MSDLAHQKILSFYNLEDGWDYGKGLAYDSAVLVTGLEILKYCQDLGIKNTDAFPSPSGGLTLSLYRNSHYYEISIALIQTYELRHYVTDELINEYKGLTKLELLEKIKECI